MPESDSPVYMRQDRHRRSDPVHARFQHALQVQTVEDGYNSGRTYYLQADSAAQCAEICDSLAACARRAREAAAAQSRLRRVQQAVCDAYESTPFQSAVAVLIIAVRLMRTHARTAAATLFQLLLPPAMPTPTLAATLSARTMRRRTEIRGNHPLYV
jgi:hypothetical protein